MIQLVRIAAVLLVFPCPLIAMGSDHIDNPGVVIEPATDITDLFAFTRVEGTKTRLILTLNTFLGGARGAKFSDVVSYEIHFFALNDAMNPHSEGNVHTIKCRFDGAATQAYRCALANKTTLAVVDGEIGEVKGPNAFRVFAGPRRDPFFFDESKVSLPRDSRVADNFSGTNSSRTSDVLAIVVDLDRDLVTLPTAMIGVFGQVVLTRTIGEQSREIIIDRVGRPEITNVTMRINDIKALWNRERTLDVAESEYHQQYRETLRNGILALDSLDKRMYWKENDVLFQKLITIFSRDYLWLNLEPSTEVREVVARPWGNYLQLEWAYLQDRPLNASGGREYGDDIMAAMLTLEISGLDGPLRDDGVARSAATAKNEFPFLNETYAESLTSKTPGVGQ